MPIISENSTSATQGADQGFLKINATSGAREASLVRRRVLSRRGSSNFFNFGPAQQAGGEENQPR